MAQLPIRATIDISIYQKVEDLENRIIKIEDCIRDISILIDQLVGGGGVKVKSSSGKGKTNRAKSKSSK